MSNASDPNAELRLHAGWWARLEGDSLDLETLAAALGSESPVQVRSFDGRYYLRMTEFDSLEQSDAVETRASEVLRVVNGAARMEHGNSREVHVDAVARVQPAGEIQHFVHMSATVHARSRISVTASVDRATDAEPRRTLTQQAVEAALSDTEAERALRIFGRDDADYRDLYHVLEIAQAAIGAEIYADGSVANVEVGRFKRTANSVHALGDQARHGRETTEPPADPMPFAEAQALVGRTLRVWLSGNR